MATLLTLSRSAGMCTYDQRFPSLFVSLGLRSGHFLSPFAHFWGNSAHFWSLLIGSVVLEMGSITPVKPLGVLAMIDEGELDWKLLVIATSDPLAVSPRASRQFACSERALLT